MNGSVVEGVGAKRIDVVRRDRRRLACHPNGEAAERAQARVLRQLAVDGVLDELGWGALGTEVVGVRAYSVVAVVCAGDDDGEKLAVGP